MKLIVMVQEQQLQLIIMAIDIMWVQKRPFVPFIYPSNHHFYTKSYCMRIAWSLKFIATLQEQQQSIHPALYMARYLAHNL